MAIKRKAGSHGCCPQPAKKASSGSHEKESTSPPPEPEAGPAPEPERQILSPEDSVTLKKSPNDPAQYKLIRLLNGLQILLVSRAQEEPHPDPSYSFLSECGQSSLLSRFELGRPIDLTATFLPELRFLPELNFLAEEFHGCELPSSPKKGGICPAFGSEQGHTSVALVVNFGGCNDPETTEGLAHLTEHMVHYGSEKHPGVTEVQEIVMNFGLFNAFTSYLITAYYNQVPDLVVEEDLGLFSEMLKKPLFEPGMLGKEANAVDNEFYLRPRGKQEVEIEVLVRNKMPSHPLARFFCGCNETLGDTPRVRGEMAKSYNNNYVASAMTLCVNSTRTIDELEKLTLKYFSGFPDGDRKTRFETNCEDSNSPLEPPKEAIHAYHQGHTSMSELSLIWILPADIWLSKESEKVPEILASLLSSSSPGSLLCHLQSKGLIWDGLAMTACLPYACFVELNLYLSDVGRKSPQKILDAISAYIDSLVSSKESDFCRFFEEERVAHLRAFKFGPTPSELEQTKAIAIGLQFAEKPEDVLASGSWEDAEFNKTSIVAALKLMQQPRRLVVFETLSKHDSLEETRAKAHKPSVIHCSTYTKTRYFTAQRPPSSSASSCNSKSSFDFPQANIYLQDEVNRRLKLGSSGNGDITFKPHNYGLILPQRLKYQSPQDRPLSLPKIVGIHAGHAGIGGRKFAAGAHIIFFSPPSVCCSPRSLALLWLWIASVEQKMVTVQSEMELGGFRTALQYKAGNFGQFTVDVVGFHPTPEQLHHATKTTLEHLFQKPVTPLEFRLAKEKFISLLEIHMGFAHSRGGLGIITESILRKLLLTPADLTADMLNALNHLTLGDLESSIAAFRKSSFAILALWGNIPVDRFEEFARTLDSLDFGPRVYNNPQIYQQGMVGLQSDIYSPGERCIRVRNEYGDGLTTTVTNLYVLGAATTEDDLVRYDMAMNFLRFGAFLYLRTQEQLGYAVSGVKLVINRPGQNPLMMFVVSITGTAHKYSVCYLDDKIDEFLANFAQIILDIPDHIFDHMKQLKNSPSDLTKNDVADWLTAKFGPGFSQGHDRCKCLMRGIRKVSIQIVPDPDKINPATCKQLKPCTCDRCSQVVEWRRAKLDGSSLKYAVGNDNYFVAL